MNIEFDRHLVPPIRSELFSAERLEQHAKSLAEAQSVGQSGRRRESLRQRLFENSRRLIADYRALAKAANARKPVTSAGEWFLDNFHIVEEQIRQVQKDLPAGYYRELPKLVEGPLSGYPRVFGIAWALIAHTDGAFDVERVERFVHSYQQIEPLKIGELWAIAITLRITLVENLRRLMEFVIARLNDAARADEIAKRILDASGEDVARLSLESIFGNDAISPTLIAHLEQRLRNQNYNADRILAEIEARLNNVGTNSDAIIHEEYQLQGADDISVRNVIKAMRLVSVTDWAAFFENVSLVDMVMRQDPIYGAMDFPSRDRYRRAIERIARQSPRDEIAVASDALEEAKRAPATMPRRCEPGYYLIGGGAAKFELQIGYRPTFSQRFWRGAAATGLAGYISLLASTLGLIVAAIVVLLLKYGVANWELFAFVFFALPPASDLAVSVINRLVTNQWAPKCLPGLAFKNGIPDELRTVLVVPALLTSQADIATLISALEVHFLSNADARLQFILLSDWTDSRSETEPSDQQLLDCAQTGIRDLNDRYAKDGPTLFFILHRNRMWNGAQERWMGWERKRGKLHELNRLLRGANDTSFLNLDGEHDQLRQDVRYVITLDADTRLPRGAAKRLIGKMAHPLNVPRFDNSGNTVIEGHGILQPRVTPSLPVGTEGSLFQWAFSGPNGLDPYAFAVSDVYQDLFEEGSYVGKGIYDVDAFERALKQKIPENTILSHDLLEGIFARAALASDVEVVEEFPSRYDVELARQHRWVRGDWQLLPWIFRRGASTGDSTRSKSISALGRWKMLDNLRRSLSAPAMLLALLYGWQMEGRIALAWTLFLIATMALPPLLPIIAGLIPRRRGASWRGHVRNLARDTLLAGTQLLFHLAFMARIAYLTLDAILRTIFRLFISRGNLLEWVTFAQTAYKRRGSWNGTALQLVGSVAFTAINSVLVWRNQPANLSFAAPFLALWALSPLIARWASRTPDVEPHLDISQDDRRALRVAARRTWAFFEKFVTAEDNFLPPDNFQETPKGEIAHRTSPTNIGLYLNAVVAARDFGWIGTFDAVAKLESTLASLQKLERYQGHFLNWYDTTSLRALEPRYVSTVDSGNLAGNLLVVKHAATEMAAASSKATVLAGIADVLNVLTEDVRAKNSPYDAALLERLAKLSDQVTGFDGSANPTAAFLELLEQQSETLASRATPVNRNGFDALTRCIQSHLLDLKPPLSALDQRLDQLANVCGELAERMQFGFLYDESRQLLTIGYRVEDQTSDPNAYDLLASEARLASFFAIAKGDVPTRHWFHLGRTLTPLGRTSALQSWSGSMFEYLMPSLIMHEPTGSLIALSNRAAVRRQIDYASRLGIPWGISESQYYALDREQNYQYSGFGVPDLGIKRGLGENTVIAPYATGLAAMVVPKLARQNLDRLTRLGARGQYGWYEAVDYTRARLPEGAGEAVIQTYMAHHQAMMILGIDAVIHDGAMRERFHADPMVKAAELLLQERMPRDVAVARLPPEAKTGAITFYDQAQSVPRYFSTPHTAMPRTHLLSNGNYSLMVTAAGGGYSRWNGLAITRWREDVTRDNWGAFIYLRDLSSGKSWSAGYQPTGREADTYEAIFAEDRATIKRIDGAISTVMEILVSPEADVEARKISITNNGSRQREIEVTSYAELALARPQEDDAHPAFSKLFVETEYLQGTRALLATRRPRSPAEPRVWAAHLSVVDGESTGDVQYETDRGKFLTRNHNARTAAAISESWPLSNSAGPVLDPIFSLRRTIRIARGQTVTVTFWTMAATSREDILDLVDRHHDANAFDRAATLAATSAQTHLQYLGVSGDEAHLFQLLANYLLYHDAGLRAPPEVLERGGRPASTLWGSGISGDFPIALVRLSQEGGVAFATQMMRAHDYWRQKQLAVDLVILNERASSYAQDLQKTLEATVHTIPSSAEGAGPHGKVFLLRADLIGPEARDALRTAARIDLSAQRGSLAEQLDALDVPVRPIPKVKPTKPAENPAPAPVASNLQFFNGFGGFSPDGREYVIQLQGDQRTPAPWINVIANRDFGFQVSAEGAGFCWAGNSQQNQITAWSNDPVSNEPGEVLYIKDLDSGEVWCPTAEPIVDPAAVYVIRHGQGYTRFEYSGRGLAAALVQFVPLDDPVKIGRLTIKNTSGQARRLQVTTYVEWALGQARAPGAPYVLTERDASSNAMFARNPRSAEWGTCIAFLDMGGRQTSWTGDRREFLGRNGALDRPVALMSDEPLSGRLGAGQDACGVQQTEITLEKGKEAEILLLLGQAKDRDAARALIVKYRATDLSQVFADVTAFWDRTLGTVQINTPDQSMNLLVNRWLLYQTLSCRMWGRAGFYQVSGAYGFRDQLQDSMALCVAQPALVREHLLRAAGRQFAEGDVQHWWLPEDGKGIRTRISDDKAWLAYVAAHYITTTGDTNVLDEIVPFLHGPTLRDGEHDAFFLPENTGEGASLYEHCARALDASLGVGSHGLPLMGTGDWNDGMNRVGEQGRGESVWLGWFLHETLARFVLHAERRHDAPRAAQWLLHMTTLAQALEDTGWDGAWYRRAYFDDGFALGSASNRECRIDAIAQSWAIISNVASPDRAHRAMEAVDKYLVRTEDGLMTLFTPPFVASSHDPGYIKGYPAGIRENGGQYTHGVLWSILAFAMMGNGDRAGELFAMLNPINHARTRTAAQRYRVEPYVACGDVYSVAPNVGRGGWTWYTGSAAWMYRVAVENILGIQFRGDILVIDPVIPRNWPQFEATVRHGNSIYEIFVDNPTHCCKGVIDVTLDGAHLKSAVVALVDDGNVHQIRITLGTRDTSGGDFH